MSFLSSWLSVSDNAAPVDRENAVVRTTVEPVRDSPIPEVDRDYNAVELDSTPELTGFSRTTAAADNTPSRQSPPVGYNPDFTSLIDNQVASAGQAPAIESAGRWGHGTAQYDASVEPVVRDGGKLGGDYFLRDAAPVQDGAADYLSGGPLSTPQDNLWAATAQANATRNARTANAATLYSALLGG